MRFIFARLDEKQFGWETFEKALKTFDENSIEKLNLNLFCEKLLPKIEPTEITSFFNNNLFHFGGGNVPYVPTYWRRLYIPLK